MEKCKDVPSSLSQQSCARLSENSSSEQQGVFPSILPQPLPRGSRPSEGLGLSPPRGSQALVLHFSHWLRLRGSMLK